MMLIKVILLEDNAIDTLKIEMMLSENIGKYQYELIGKFETLDSLLRFWANHQADVIIADIFNQKHPMGLELLKSPQAAFTPIVLMTNTQDKEVYVKAQAHRGVHCLIKPFHGITLVSAIEQALEQQQRSKQYDLIDQKYLYLSGIGGRRERILFEEIVYLSSEANNCFIYTSTRKYVLKKSLTQLLSESLDETFVRVHQQYIVSKKHIKLIDNHNVTLAGEIVVPLSRRFRKAVLMALKTS